MDPDIDSYHIVFNILLTILLFTVDISYNNAQNIVYNTLVADLLM
jgi:uncharacterized membrane protein YciS (DUF1049 family)